MITRLRFLAALLPLAALAAPVFEQDKTQVECFDFLEVTLRVEGPPPNNPFTQATLTGEFGLPDQATRPVEGFCDSTDGRTFRIRFMPMAPGRHVYSVRYKSGAQELTYQGEFRAVRGDRPGLLRVDPEYEWHLFRHPSWVEQMGDLIKSSDPYDHLISVHGRGDFPFRKSRWVGYVMFQSWDEHGGYAFMSSNRLEQIATGRPLPQINEEYGYEDHYPYPWGQARRWPARTADTRRRLAWEMTMAGAYQTTGERANIPEFGGWITGRGNDQMTLLIGYGYLRDFFERFAWWKLQPRPELLRVAPEPPVTDTSKPRDGVAPLPLLHGQPLCLAEPGERYVIYLPRGGTVAVLLAAGPYTARWFNPRAGRFLDSTFSAAGGKWNSPPAPDAEDWVLLIEPAGPRARS